MPGHVFLEGSRVTLRTVEQCERDRRVLGAVRNRPEFRRTLGFDAPWPDGRVEAFLESTLPEESNHNIFVCLPEGEAPEEAAATGAAGAGQPPEAATADGPTIIGGADLFDVDRVSGTLAYWLFERFRGNGYATEAVSVLLDHAFGELGLHRVEADTFSENGGSLALLERLGFVHEGTARECRIAGTEYRNVERYALLETEWTGSEALE